MFSHTCFIIVCIVSKLSLLMAVTNWFQKYAMSAIPMQVHLNNSLVDIVKLSAMFPLCELCCTETSPLPSSNLSSEHNTMNTFTFTHISELILWIMRARQSKLMEAGSICVYSGQCLLVPCC